MHDFIQNLSFNSQSPFPAARTVPEALRLLVSTYNEIPGYRPSPRPRAPKRRPARKSAPLTNNS